MAVTGATAGNSNTMSTMDLFSADSLSSLTGSFRDRFGSSLISDGERRLAQYADQDINTNMAINRKLLTKMKSDTVSETNEDVALGTTGTEKNLTSGHVDDAPVSGNEFRLMNIRV